MKFSRCLLFLAATVLLALGATDASAQLSPYSQDFEGLSPTAPGSLGGDGWLVSGLVFDGGGAFKFFFGNFAAPNGGAAWSAIATGEAGAPQGTQYINTYSNYDCCGPGTTNEGHFDPLGLETVEANIFQEQVIGAGDIGKTAVFAFDAKRPDPALNDPDTTLVAPSEGVAFLRTLDPNANFATTNFITLDALTLSETTWSSHSLTLDLSAPALSGQVLQFGFQNRASAFDPTGVYYDNINFAAVPEPSTLALVGLGLVAMAGTRRKGT